MLAESNSGISSTSNSAFHSLLTGREGLILGDGNQVSLQHNSIEHDKRTVGRSECDPDCSAKAENQPPPENNPSEPDQVTEGCREPDAAHSFHTNWECQSARPKHIQMQRPMDPPLWPISSPVSDGLAKDFLARHSRDRALQGSLYTDDKDLENNETVVDDMQGTSIESCNQESSSSCWSGPRASLVLVESNSGISFTSNSAFHSAFTGSSPKTENQPVPQQNSSDSDQVTERSHEPDAVSSSERNWEHQGTQTQSSSSESGVAREFIARHSQDRSILQSCNLFHASEAISERRYFGAIDTSSCERLGGAFSDVTSGGSTARSGFSGSNFHNESSYSSSTHNTAEPLQSFTGQSHCPWVRNGMSSDGVNTGNCLLPRNSFANRNHSLNGEQDFSRECDSPLNQNFLIGRLISPNPRFVYGLTSSNFTAGI